MHTPPDLEHTTGPTVTPLVAHHSPSDLYRNFASQLELLKPVLLGAVPMSFFLSIFIDLLFNHAGAL